MATKQNSEANEKKKNLHAGHRGRMRNKFLQQDIEAFEMHEILELLLFYSLPQKNTNELGHILMNHFGSISAVFDASTDELCSIPGIKENTAVLIKLIPSLARVYIQDKTCSNLRSIDSMEDMVSCAQAKFIGVQEEQVYGIMLDNARNIVGECLFAKGGFDSVNLPIELVVQELLRHKSKNLILTHNHPNGMALPSLNDKMVTQRLEKELQVLDIRLLEHVIIGKGEHDVVCMYAHGYLRSDFD